MDIQVVRNYLQELGSRYIRLNDFNEIEVDTCLFLKANMSKAEVKSFIYSVFDDMIEDKKNNEIGEVGFSLTNVVLNSFLDLIEDYEFTECFKCDVCGRIYYKDSVIYFWCNTLDGYLRFSYEGEKEGEE